MSEDISHRGGDPCKLRLTALEQDVLYHHLMETIEEAEDAYKFVLDDILDQLPEEDITQRPPSVETLIEVGYFDAPKLAEFDVEVVES